MENDLTKLTSFQPLTPVSASSRFSFSKWIDGLTKRKLSQAPNLPSTREQSSSKNGITESMEDKPEGATAERVKIYYFIYNIIISK